MDIDPCGPPGERDAPNRMEYLEVRNIYFWRRILVEKIDVKLGWTRRSVNTRLFWALLVRRLAHAGRIEGEPRLVVGDGSGHSTSEAAETATVHEVLMLVGKLYHVTYVIRPARYFVRPLLLLSASCT